MSTAGYIYAGVTRWRGGTRSGVYRAAIGEHKWEEMNDGFPAEIHVQAVVVSPEDPATIMAATNDGPYRSRNRGKSWERLAFPERNRQIWSLHYEPGNNKIVYAGASPVEIFKSEDGGDNWERVPGSALPSRLDTGKFVNRVMRLAADPGNPDTVFGACEVNGMMISLDRGRTWKDINDPLVRMVEERPELKSAILTKSELEGMFDIHSLCCSTAAPDTVFIACRMGLFTSADKGRSWTDLRISSFNPYSYGRDIKVSPQDPRTLYACVSVASHGETGAVVTSSDLGKTWKRFDHGTQPKGTMMAVAPSPKDAGTVYAASRAGQVFGTNDGGKSWQTHLLPEGCDGVYSLVCGG
jgi:photosystem II stability/assembly factor-like uncharacterized protein